MKYECPATASVSNRNHRSLTLIIKREQVNPYQNLNKDDNIPQLSMHRDDSGRTVHHQIEPEVSTQKMNITACVILVSTHLDPCWQYSFYTVLKFPLHDLWEGEDCGTSGDIYVL